MALVPGGRALLNKHSSSKKDVQVVLMPSMTLMKGAVEDWCKRTRFKLGDKMRGHFSEEVTFDLSIGG